MKIAFLIFLFLTPLITFADYFDQLLAQEEVEVDCSNILNFVQEYIELNDKNQSLLVVSATRFSSEVGNIQLSQKMEQVKTDINQTVFLIEDNQMVLSDMSSLILETLPKCLKTTPAEE